MEAEVTQLSGGNAAQCPPIYDGWEIEEQLRHFGRVLGCKPPASPAPLPEFGAKRERAQDVAPFGALKQHSHRLDGRHGVPPRHGKRARIAKKASAAAPTPTPAPGDLTLAILAWLSLLPGTAGFVCGIALMGWSRWTDRAELWTIGMPILVAGQIALVLGLLLQLDRMWRTKRWNARQQKAINRRLDKLKKDRKLGAARTPSSAFYTHWSSGAGPEILFSDLKSQLDLLAAKISEQ
jgi:hypothetical protein